MAGSTSPRRAFAYFGWATLAYTMFVVLFGAWVRITGSGAGCGQHWPTCHGQIVPRSPSVATIIEFTHRATSGAYGLLVVVLLIWAIRSFPRGHLARLGAWLTLVFTITEALVGAGLVTRGLVADNASIERALMMSLHLVNTSLLTGALALTCWSGARPQSRARLDWQRQRGPALVLLGVLVGMIIVGMSGAITALGDTLYPLADGSIAESLASDQQSDAHFLQRTRALHPLLAIGIGTVVLIVAQNLAGRPSGSAAQRYWANVVSVGVLAQIAAGVVNIMLSAPGWMQIVHLMLGTSLWIAVVLLTASVVEPR
ncbi:MAG: COX15/CtaA family protein [Nannocystaceae bacterium]|nr:COX15/CtaA family protein [Nannocystaceae bacterium]